MFVLLLKIILEKTGWTQCLVVCSGLLLAGHVATAGVYQRAKDGKTLIWNNFPAAGDMVSWSGKRDSNGYATGAGTLTWYKAETTSQTGTLLPTKGRPAVITRYSGTMVHGKLNGPVRNVDADGKTFQFTFANGIKTLGRPPETAASDSRQEERISENPKPPAEGPVPSAALQPFKQQTPKPKVDQTRATSPSPPVKPRSPPPVESPVVEVASIHSTPIPAAPNEDDLGVAVKERIIADFKEETRTVFSQVGEATDNFRAVERFDSVAKLPAPVSESVGSLVQRARDFRSKVGYETALRQFRTETETVDALSAIDQINRSIAANDGSDADAKATDFLKSNPEPSADSERGLWQYVTSVRQLCSRLEKDADVHLQRAQSFAAASRTSDAIREYQEAYRIFPNPDTAEKIRQLQTNSLGL